MNKNPKLYLWLFAILSFVLLVIVLIRPFFQEYYVIPFFTPLFHNFGGNIFAGIIQGLLFVFLTLYLDAQTQKKIDQIYEATKKSEEVLSRREQLLRREQLIAQFENFMKRESYHNARFPDLTTPTNTLGLDYTIVPVRKPDNGEPRTYTNEMETMFVVKIKGPAHWEVLEAQQKEDYKDSPIKDDEFYFCRFYNDSWHMMPDNMPVEAHRFYLSGKVGPVLHGVSANEFMSSYENQLQDKQKVKTLHLQSDGTPLPPGTSGGVDAYEIYKDNGGNLFLRINDSRLKEIYYTNHPHTYDETSWFLVIDKIRGDASGAKLEAIKTVVQRELGLLNLEPKKVQWYQTDEHRHSL